MPSAAIGARQRLGPAPLAWLFNRLASHWTGKSISAAAFRSLRSCAVDGMLWEVPDTPENRQAYGCGRSRFSAGAWPQVRAACLMDTHAPDHSLTLFDRRYCSASFLLNWRHGGVERNWLMRAKSLLRYEVMQAFAPGDWRVRMSVSPQAQQQRSALPAHWEARLIESEVAGISRRFLTSLLDPKAYPAHEGAHYTALGN